MRGRSSSNDYDDNGNLVSAGSSTYGWNARDELVGTSAGSGTFAYDAFGRRTSRTVGGSTATYLHDGLNPVVADGEFWLNGLGLDERYARIVGTAVTSVLTDALGSTVALSDAAGATTASFAYEPYGAATKTGTSDTAFRFTGREDDGATGLQYFRSRYYSAEMGRFISSDPIGLAGGANTYAYVNGDPAGANDPLGLAFTSVDWACAKDPMFCAEIMGQMVRNNAAVRGDPCAMEAAEALSGAMMTMATVATVATIVSAVPRAAAARGASLAAREIKLVDGFYTAEGSAFKFSKAYYEKLWATGRGAPFLQADEVVRTATSITLDPAGKAGFFRYANEVTEMIYNPVTREVWHLMPIK